MIENEIKIDIEKEDKELEKYKKQKEILKATSDEVYNEYTKETYWVSDGYKDVKPLIINKLNSQLNVIKDNGTIFLIKKIHKSLPCGGWGYLITKGEFLKKFK